jgi:hypothetical protein
MTASAATGHYKHESKRYNSTTYMSFSEPSFSLHVLPRPPMGARDRPGRSVTRSPSPGGVKGDLCQHADTVFVIPALKLSQHLGCDLSLERFRSGDERVLRDLQNSEIKMEASRRRWNTHKCCIDIFSHGNQCSLLAHGRDFCS